MEKLRITMFIILDKSSKNAPKVPYISSRFAQILANLLPIFDSLLFQNLFAYGLQFLLNLLEINHLRNNSTKP